MTRIHALALSAAAVVALAACSNRTTDVTAGSGDTASSTTTAPPGDGPPTAAAGLVLQLRTGGGFVPVEFNFAAVPELSVYDDGRVVVTGPTTLEFPGPALPNLLMGRLSPAAVPAALDEAAAAGVGTGVDFGSPPVADAPSTTFVLVRGGRTLTTEVYALGFEAGGTLSADQQANRRRFAALAERLRELGAGASEPYEAQAVSVLVRDDSSTGSTPSPGEAPLDPVPGRADWPLGDLATGGVEQFGGRCLGFTGAEADAVLAAAASARANTAWQSAGRTWSLTFRPELPGVEPCGAR